ncbi:hypothetical protein ACIA8C_35910 [Nocardia sp. NPDC051321]|uniref:hypothetical protein n=1 Tax=Nocardia sp. NPDC051321 TaxID=3364323 RepID=UPI0037944CE2
MREISPAGFGEFTRAIELTEEEGGWRTEWVLGLYAVSPLIGTSQPARVSAAQRRGAGTPRRILTADTQPARSSDSGSGAIMWA